MRTHGPVTRREVVSISCDRCGASAEAGDPEAAEFLGHHDVGGYGSVFGDGTSVDLDLCQRCVRDVLGPWLRLGKSEPVLDAAGRPEGGAPSVVPGALPDLGAPDPAD